MLRGAFDLGVTHFDLANNYGPPPGSAEETFSRVLKTDFHGYRDERVGHRAHRAHHWIVHRRTSYQLPAAITREGTFSGSFWNLTAPRWR